MHIDIYNYCNVYLADSPWLFSHPCINFDLHRFYKDDTAPDIYRSMFYEICASYDNFDHIYTDGSKMGDRVASAAICSNMVRSTRLPNNASIFRAELYAITLAMYFVHRSRNSSSYFLTRCLALKQQWESNHLLLDTKSCKHPRQRESRRCG